MSSPSETDHAIPVLEPGSYRDFTARVFYAGRRVFRGLSAIAADQWRDVAAASFFQKSQASHAIVPTRELTPAERASLSAELGSAAAENSPWNGWAVVLEHERLPFISYPYEWSFSMLREAALLHLELLDQALADGFMTKDGTAFNVQWLGTRPTFVDVTSFVRYKDGESWPGYRQFCQTFLFPLMLQAYRKVAFQSWLRGDLEGMSPREFRKLLSWRDCLRPGVFKHVIVHSMMERQVRETSRSTHDRLARSGVNRDVVRAVVRNLRNVVLSLQSPAASHWTGYVQDNSYSPADRQRKAAFVRAAVQEIKPRRVWDMGSNTGEYSRICAETAQCVVALDSDAACIEHLYLKLREENLANILPLVFNVVNSSPNMGWRGRERKGLAERGRPHLCLCLALLHHLSIGASVPLGEIVQWLRDLGTSVVFEFVDRDDPLAARLLAGRPDGCPDYRRDAFESHLGQAFETVRTESLSNGRRTLYFARPRA